MANTTSFSTWYFHNQHVQQEVKGGQFVSAETTLIAAGPPSITSDVYRANVKPTSATTTKPAIIGVTGNLDVDVYPVALLESFGLQQNRQLQRIFEIGSSRSYFVPGRNIGSIALGRSFYYGPSLLRVLYAYYQSDGDIKIGTTGKLYKDSDTYHTSPNWATYNMSGVASSTALHKVKRNPGYDCMFIDLASDLFAQPTGMAVYFKDMNDSTVGAFYLECCYVQGHQLTVNSGSVLIMEGAQLQYDILVPIKMM